MANPDNPDPSRYGAVPLFWGTLFIGAITVSMSTKMETITEERAKRRKAKMQAIQV